MDYVTGVTATEPSYNNSSLLTLNQTKLSKYDFVTTTDESIIKKPIHKHHKHTLSQPEIKVASNCTNTVMKFFKPQVEEVKRLDVNDLKNVKRSSMFVSNKHQFAKNSLNKENKGKMIELTFKLLYLK